MSGELTFKDFTFQGFRSKSCIIHFKKLNHVPVIRPKISLEIPSPLNLKLNSRTEIDEDNEFILDGDFDKRIVRQTLTKTRTMREKRKNSILNILSKKRNIININNDDE